MNEKADTSTNPVPPDQRYSLARKLAIATGVGVAGAALTSVALLNGGNSAPAPEPDISPAPSNTTSAILEGQPSEAPTTAHSQPTPSESPTQPTSPVTTHNNAPHTSHTSEPGTPYESNGSANLIPVPAHSHSATPTPRPPEDGGSANLIPVVSPSNTPTQQ